MPYIIVEFGGQQTFGGYLMVDGGRRIKLEDDLMIEVPAGPHHLEFSSQSGAQRGMANLNAMVGNYNTAAWAERNSIDGTISVRMGSMDVMLFTVISDAAGRILDQPTYVVKEVTPEKMEELDEMYNERIAHAQSEAGKKESLVTPDGKSAVVELILCIFLGSLGVHKFYRGKIGIGILYLCTMGLFGIGWLVDVIKLIGQVCKK